MATYRVRGNSVQCQIRLEGLPPQTGSFKTKKEAEAWAKETEAQLRARLNVTGNDLKLKDLIVRYRDTIAIRQKSYKGFLGPYLTAFLRESICEKTINELTIKDFVEYRDKRLDVVKPSTLKGELSIYQKAFKTAAKDWLIPIPNFIQQLEFKAKSFERVRRISTAERIAIRNVILNRKRLSLDQRLLIADIFDFALETGMRLGEILRVRPHHYNPELSTLVISITKTDDPRTIGLTKIACNILESRIHQSPCFPIKPVRFKNTWQRLKQSMPLGVADIRFHDTRHEAISGFFDLGLSMPEVQNQSGHKDYKTLQRYSHAKINNIVAKLHHK